MSAWLRDKQKRSMRRAPRGSYLNVRVFVPTGEYQKIESVTALDAHGNSVSLNILGTRLTNWNGSE